MSLTLIAFNEWIMAINDGSATASLNPTATLAILNPGLDVIATVAASLAVNVTGIQRELLSKSLQETLLYCAGFQADINYQQLETRLVRYLSRRGTGSLIQRFLSLSFFNFVWFETGESFRADAFTAAAFEKEMDEVDRTCQKAVASSWKSFQSRPQPLNKWSARELVRKIEAQLRGD